MTEETKPSPQTQSQQNSSGLWKVLGVSAAIIAVPPIVSVWAWKTENLWFVGLLATILICFVACACLESFGTAKKRVDTQVFFEFLTVILQAWFS